MLPGRTTIRTLARPAFLYPAFPRGAFRRGAFLHRCVLLLLLALALLPASRASAQAQEAAAGAVAIVTVAGAIGPASADHVTRAITRAQRDGAQLVVIQMDTPGGLDLSMRTIIKAILSSPVPVATYVAPSGARAASAGTYILYASHVAAMAPGTNLGAATPVQLGGGEQPERSPRQPLQPKDAQPGDEKTRGAQEGKEAEAARDDRRRIEDRAPDEPAGEPTTTPSTRKQVNDAAAYIRGLAQLRGRNIEWAERAVREAVSLSAEEALKQNVVDVVAGSIPDLLRQLDGRKLKVGEQERVLQTANAQVVNYETDWRVKFLAVITDPSIALLLMTIGMYGLIIEFSNPGFGVPGVLGAICLLIALYALQMLPVNYAGLALILLGLAFMVAEAFVPSFGILGLGGVVAFITGAVILIDTEVPGFGIPLAVIGGIAVTSAVLVALTVGVVLKTRRKPVVSGGSDLVGCVADVVNATAEHAWVQLRGETWQVHSSTPLQRGQRVRVTARHGLVLEVAPHNEGE